MTLLALLPAILSSLLLAAHYLRAGQTLALVAALLVLPLLMVRRPPAARAVQAILLLGAWEWIGTLSALVSERRATGQPWARLAWILGAAAAFTALSPLLFETRRLAQRYGLGARPREGGKLRPS